MGVNEKGFSVVNSTARDLTGGTTGFDNGELMRYALGNCATVSEFEALLRTTDSIGRRTQANFAVIDSCGKAALFETGGKAHWKYDADNPEQAPDGFIVRSNFSVQGGGDEGMERYLRANDLLSALHEEDSISYKAIIHRFMRDFSDFQGQVYL